MDEVWKPVVGFEGFYEVSDLGRVKSVERHYDKSVHGCHGKYGGVVIKDACNGRGYRYVSLYVKRKRKNKYVHRMVLEAFVGRQPEGFECCHNDGNKANNHLKNLRWASPSENNRDKRLHGTDNSGERNAMASMNAAVAECIIKSNLKAKELAVLLGVSENNVRRIKRGDRWKHLHEDLLEKTKLALLMGELEGDVVALEKELMGK